jgi:hypothetical protein
VGNGIEFMGLTPDTKKRVQDHLDSIDPQRANMFERKASE